MKEIAFNLVRPVRITPLVGESLVDIITTGDVLVTECRPTEHRQRAVVIAETEHASLKSSPQGLYQTVKIRLPLADANEHEFQKQLSMLFED